MRFDTDFTVSKKECQNGKAHRELDRLQLAYGGKWKISFQFNERTHRWRIQARNY